MTERNLSTRHAQEFADFLSYEFPDSLTTATDGLLRSELEDEVIDHYLEMSW